MSKSLRFALEQVASLESVFRVSSPTLTLLPVLSSPIKGIKIPEKYINYKEMFLIPCLKKNERTENDYKNWIERKQRDTE